MSLVARQIPALYNGVSQQPATTRLPSQAEAQVNGWSSVVDGLKKRPPTEHLAKLVSADLSSAYTHIINRDSQERYVVVLLDGDIKVFDLAGNEKTVAMPTRAPWQASTAYSTVSVTRRPTTPNGFLYRVHTAGTSGVTQPTWPTTLGATVADGTVTWQCVPDYLNVNDPQTDFSCVTVADFTFIVNKTVFCAMAPAGDDEKAADTSQISMRDTKMSPGEFALVATMVANAFKRGTYTPNPAGTFRGTKQSLQDIPTENPAPIDGDIWEIQGTGETGFATYYVRRNGGVWDETVKPNLINRLLECTLPHALVRLQDGTFELQVFSWAPRRVGDENTNPNPSFVGRQIREVFFHKNRLGFCVDENVIMSRVGDFGNFYRMTVVDLLDDETVDVAASTTQVTKFNYAVPFNKALMLCSDQVQFVMSDPGALTPGSVSLDVATRYLMSPRVRPEALGSDFYFASEGAAYGRVLEYYVREGENGTEAADVSAHVPRYIPKNITAMFGSADLDLLCVVSADAPNRLYTYKFYWTGENDKAQSAWSHWEFLPGDEILDGALLDSKLYLIVQRSDGVYLERCNLESGAAATGLTHEVYLDRRASVVGTYLDVEGKTEFTLPYPVEISDRPSFMLVRGGGFAVPGAAVSVTAGDYQWSSLTTFKVNGDFAGQCFGGMKFTFRYTFSEQFMKNAADVPITTGRLQLRTFTVYYTGTAYFETEVAPYGNDAGVEQIVPDKFATFEGKTLGEQSLVVGQPAFSEGSYSFQVYGNADVAVVSLVNSSPYASNFQAAEWEGFYQNRISRLV